MLVDCAEGSQALLRKMRLPLNSLTHIFLSHMHGDHCLGVPGLLGTLSLLGKTGRVTLVMPSGGVDIMRRMTEYFCRESTFEIELAGVDGDGGIVADFPGLTVEAIRLSHRIPTYGYVFREKPKPRHMRGDMKTFYNIPNYACASIKAGADWVSPDGTVIPNSRLTTDPTPSVSYAYCSDTMYFPELARAVNGVDVIYHDSTYDATMASQALRRGHSTAAQAALTARDAGARLLILGHFSQRYSTTELLLEQAREIFPDTIAAYDGMKLDLLSAVSKTCHK